MPGLREKAISGLQVGDTFAVTRTFTEADMVQFASISRDYNPIHFDQRFAEVKKLRGRICHGLLVAGLITEIGGQLGWLASRMVFSFERPVYFGDTIRCEMTIKSIGDHGRAEAEATYSNQSGESVLKACLSGIIPGGPEKHVLGEMLAEGDPTNELARRSP